MVSGLPSSGVQPKRALLKQFMKKNYFFMSAFAAVAALFMTACSDSSDIPVVPETADLDVTELVSTTGWGQGGMVPDWAAPAITTSDGRQTALAEVYHGSNDGIAETGVLMQQTLDVANGNYVVELYANSYFTPERGFDSDMADGAEDVAYVFANDVKTFIVSKVGTSFTEPGLYTINVKVTDGKLTLGFGKEKAGTNWHTIQIKSLIQKDAPIPDPKDPEPEPEPDLTTLIATDGWGQGGMVPDWAAPAVTTSDGRQTAMAEVYHGSNEGIAETGVLMQQTINVENGTYIVELYANSYFTPERGFDSDMADGAEDVAYVFANDAKTFIVSKVGTSFTEPGLYSVEGVVTDGTLTIGFGKDKAGTNWHTIQIKSLTLKK